MTKRWIQKATENIKAFNNSLTPEQKKEHASKAGKASWGKLTIEQKAAKLKKMRDARK